MSEQRCAFCGVTEGFVHRRRPFRWQDVAGRLVCDDDCAGLERLRQAAEAAPRLMALDEADGRRVVDVAAWAAEHRRGDATMSEVIHSAPVEPAEIEALGPAGVEIALAWLEEHAPDAVDDLKLLGAHRFGGDTPVAFILSAYKREVAKRAALIPAEVS